MTVITKTRLSKIWSREENLERLKIRPKTAIWRVTNTRKIWKTAIQSMSNRVKLDADALIGLYGSASSREVYQWLPSKEDPLITPRSRGDENQDASWALDRELGVPGRISQELLFTRREDLQAPYKAQTSQSWTIWCENPPLCPGRTPDPCRIQDRPGVVRRDNRHLLEVPPKE